MGMISVRCNTTTTAPPSASRRTSSAARRAEGDPSMASRWPRASDRRSRRRTPCVIPEGAGTVNPSGGIAWVLCAVPTERASRRHPPTGHECPQRSEDERPGGRQGLSRMKRRSDACLSVPPSGRWRGGGSSIASSRWLRAARSSGTLRPGSPRRSGSSGRSSHRRRRGVPAQAGNTALGVLDVAVG